MIIFSYFSSKPYVVTPHLNGLDETVQMRGHNICFYAELTKIIPSYHQILPLFSRALSNTDSFCQTASDYSDRGSGFDTRSVHILSWK